MIVLTKRNHEKFVVNHLQIEYIETIPESKIVMMNHDFYLVRESVDEIIDRIAKCAFAQAQAVHRVGGVTAVSRGLGQLTVYIGDSHVLARAAEQGHAQVARALAGLVVAVAQAGHAVGVGHHANGHRADDHLLAGLGAGAADDAYGFLCVGVDAATGKAVFSDQLVPIRFPGVGAKDGANGELELKWPTTAVEGGDANAVGKLHDAMMAADPDAGTKAEPWPKATFNGITVDGKTGVISGTCAETGAAWPSLLVR